MLIVVKRNQRLMIVEGDQLIYSPPDFIQVLDRQELKDLALRMSEPGANRFEQIMAYETTARRRGQRR